jgi:hypothetical protein
MALKLLKIAQRCWRRLDGTRPLAAVRTVVKFVNGVQKSN